MITVRGVGPTRDSYPLGASQPNHQPSGRITSLARGPSRGRMYAGCFSGVWRSDDDGHNWFQLTWPQPGLGIVQADVPGALLAPHVFEIAVSPADGDIVLVSAIDSQFRAPQDGIWRSTDGGASWTLVIMTGNVCHIVWAPDDPMLVYAALGSVVGISRDAGATWTFRGVGSAAWHLAVGPLEAGGTRRVYVAGDSRIAFSADGGTTWMADQGTQTIRDVRQVLGDFQEACGGTRVGGFAGQTGYSNGSAGQVLALDPGNPARLFLATTGGALGPSYNRPAVPDGTLCNTRCERLAGEGSLWVGDFTNFALNGAAQWGLVPGPPVAADTTPSGNAYVVTHPTPDGFLLFFSDNDHVHVASGMPAATTGWHRLDGEDVSVSRTRFPRLFMHVDPHAMVVSPNFAISLAPATGVAPPYDQCSVLAQHLGGTIWMANDGGVWWSDDGGGHWNRARGLETLDPVNIAGLFRPGKVPALYFGCGDNDEFFSRDGGVSWDDPREGCGDCDAWFADPARADRIVQLLPRRGFATDLNGVISIITSGSASGYPDAASSGQKRYVPTTRRRALSPTRLVPYATSAVVLRGYRPLIQTLATEQPPPDGDYVFIDQAMDGTARLLRTTTISSITTLADWANPAKAQQVGPNVPMPADIVQAGGGHARPAFYIGDAPGNVYKLNPRAGSWDQIVPQGTGGSIVGMALRWFIDPYEPNTIYVLDTGGIKLSVDGGASWAPDPWLTSVATAGGKLKISPSLLQDMVFLRGERQTRFAMGTAGVFWTPNFGVEWFSLLNAIALPGRPEAAFFDALGDPSDRALYVACEARGLLRIGGIPGPSPFQPPEPLDLMFFAAVLEA